MQCIKATQDVTFTSVCFYREMVYGYNACAGESITKIYKCPSSTKESQDPNLLAIFITISWKAFSNCAQLHKTIVIFCPHNALQFPFYFQDFEIKLVLTSLTICPCWLLNSIVFGAFPTSYLRSDLFLIQPRLSKSYPRSPFLQVAVKLFCWESVMQMLFDHKGQVKPESLFPIATPKTNHHKHRDHTHAYTTQTHTHLFSVQKSELSQGQV